MQTARSACGIKPGREAVWAGSSGDLPPPAARSSLRFALFEEQPVAQVKRGQGDEDVDELPKRGMATAPETADRLDEGLRTFLGEIEKAGDGAELCRHQTQGRDEKKPVRTRDEREEDARREE